MVAALPRRHRTMPRWWCWTPLSEEDGDKKDTVIGVDPAKRVFQLHRAAMTGEVKFRKKLSRDQVRAFMASQPAGLVVFEACWSASYRRPSAVCTMPRTIPRSILPRSLFTPNARMSYSTAPFPSWRTIVSSEKTRAKSRSTKGQITSL